jgi:hypothetical protein
MISRVDIVLLNKSLVSENLVFKMSSPPFPVSRPSSPHGFYKTESSHLCRGLPVGSLSHKFLGFYLSACSLHFLLWCYIKSVIGEIYDSFIIPSFLL